MEIAATIPQLFFWVYVVTFSFRVSQPAYIANSASEHREQRLAVWWYGPLVKNMRDGTVPLVIVFFRRLNDDGSFGDDWIIRKVALTELGRLRLGSVWQEGKRVGDVPLVEETFENLDFSQDGWSFVTPSLGEGIDGFPPQEYPIRYERDKNFLLSFNLPRGKRLLIPCLEYLVRCYGHSAEVPRVLATYRWEGVISRFFMPLEDTAMPRTWPVKLTERVHNDDTVFLAHIKYCDYARRAAKDIYAQVEAVSPSNAFLKVKPWFSGPAMLKVKGLWINDGRSFLALRILGANQPSGNTIIRIRDRFDDVTLDHTGELANEGTGGFVRELRRVSETIDLTSDEAPDHGSMPIDIENEKMEILGEPREIIKRAQAATRGRITHRPSDQVIRAASTGEPYGSGKGVGYASIHSPAVIESKGVLRDMWNAVNYIQKTASGVIQRVGWFTFLDGFRYDDEPKLIGLPAYGSADGELSTALRNWVYYDQDARVPRGVLVMLLHTREGKICIVETQRRTWMGGMDGEGREEQFMGLVFIVRPNEDLHRLMRKLLSCIRSKKGVATQVISALGWGFPVFAFKHVPAKDETVPCEAAVKNALRKVGVFA